MTYFVPAGKYVYGHWKCDHEQGKLLKPLPITKIIETYQGCIRIPPVVEAMFDRKLDADYPEFWVKRSDLGEYVPPPVAPPSLNVTVSAGVYKGDTNFNIEATGKPEDVIDAIQKTMKLIQGG